MRATAAIVVTKGGPFTLEDVDVDEPRAGEVLVRIVASGVCHTDLIVRDQWYPPELPAVLGHEGAGVVEQVGSDVSTVRPGDRVVVSFAFCRNCRHCLGGRVAYCEQFVPLNFGGRRPTGRVRSGSTAPRSTPTSSASRRSAPTRSRPRTRW